MSARTKRTAPATVPLQPELIDDLCMASALLTCWRRSLPLHGGDMENLVAGDEDASSLQVSMRAISELLAKANETFIDEISPATRDMPGMALWYASRLAEHVEETLWRMADGSDKQPIECAVLDQAAQYVQGQIADALHWLQRAPGAEVQAWALTADRQRHAGGLLTALERAAGLVQGAAS